MSFDASILLYEQLLVVVDLCDDFESRLAQARDARVLDVGFLGDFVLLHISLAELHSQFPSFLAFLPLLSLSLQVRFVLDCFKGFTSICYCKSACMYIVWRIKYITGCPPLMTVISQSGYFFSNVSFKALATSSLRSLP